VQDEKSVLKNEGQRAAVCDEEKAELSEDVRADWLTDPT
jgi:hypothetical protein